MCQTTTYETKINADLYGLIQAVDMVCLMLGPKFLHIRVTSPHQKTLRIINVPLVVEDDTS